MKRRQFISTAAMGIGGTLLFSGLPLAVINALQQAAGIQPGFQTFPIRELLGKDFPGTLKMMAGMGYK